MRIFCLCFYKRLLLFDWCITKKYNYVSEFIHIPCSHFELKPFLMSESWVLRKKKSWKLFDLRKWSQESFKIRKKDPKKHILSTWNCEKKQTQAKSIIWISCLSKVLSIKLLRKSSPERTRYYLNEISLTGKRNFRLCPQFIEKISIYDMKELF